MTLNLPVIAVTWGKEESGCEWINSQVPQKLGPDYQLTEEQCALDETALDLTSIIVDAQDNIKEQEGFGNFAFQCADYISVSLNVLCLFFNHEFRVSTVGTRLSLACRSSSSSSLFFTLF